MTTKKTSKYALPEGWMIVKIDAHVTRSRTMNPTYCLSYWPQKWAQHYRGSLWKPER